jgi:hypothetical protein
MASRFSRLPDDTYVEHDPDAGWMGVSRYAHGLATGASFAACAGAYER